MTDDIELTDEQKAAVTAGADRDILIVAGAGSGKTLTMTERIIWLITENKVPAEQILGLTFTRKATGELLSRVSRSVEECAGADGPSPRPHVATYDSFFESIVRRYGLLMGMDPRMVPLSDAGAQQLASDVVGRNLDLIFSKGLTEDTTEDEGDASSGSPDAGGFDKLVEDLKNLSDNIANFMIGDDCLSVADAIGRIKEWDAHFKEKLGELRGEGTTRDTGAGRPEYKAKDVAGYHKQLIDYLENVVDRREVLLGLVEQYDQAKRAAGMAEYSDFTIAAYQLVVAHPFIGEECRRRYTHVFLDEYQDTSTTQASLLARIFHADQDHRSPVTAVGDPRQAIYGWRGASPDAFRFFEERFGLSDADVFSLSLSQRNPRAILEAANHVAAAVQSDGDGIHSAPLRAKGDETGLLALAGFRSRDEEAAAVAAVAKQAKEKYGDGGEVPIAVLVRTKTHMDDYREALEAKGLRCQVVGNAALLERPDLADLVAALEVVSDHTNYAALQRLLLSPRTGMGIQDVRGLARLAAARNASYQRRLLAQSGIALTTPETPGIKASDKPGERRAKTRRWMSGVRKAAGERADSLPIGVTLVDVLLSGDWTEDIGMFGYEISDEGSAAAMHVSRMLRDIEDASNGSLEDVIRTASRALDLDTDALVSDSIHGTESSYASALEQFVALAHSYEQELPAGLHATLRGFTSWLGSAKKVDGPDNLAAGVDAVLMTVHQAKGLEWPAVAVVDMGNGNFPLKSNKGDSLTVTAKNGDEESYAAPQGVTYFSECNCWLDHAYDVPPQTRVDCGILPKFPHDPDASDPLAAIRTVDDLEREYSDEARRQTSKSHDGMLSQREAYGRRLHDDERHIAYVALTRAKHMALLTFNREGDKGDAPKGGEDGEDAIDIFKRAEKKKGKAEGPSKTSPFWLECYCHMKNRGTGYGKTDLSTGIIVGGDAKCRKEIGNLLSSAAHGDAGWPTSGVWPQSLEEKSRDALSKGTAAVADAAAASPGDKNSLECRTQHLVHTAQQDAAEMGNIINRANKVKQTRSGSPTGLEKNGGYAGDPYEIGRGARSVLRPRPKGPGSLPSSKGNAFHAWAKRYLDALIESDAHYSTEKMGEDLKNDADMDKDVKQWCCDFMHSSWLRRGENGAPYAAELDLSAWIGDHVISGTLDAVFHGPLPPDALKAAGRTGEGIRYTIVDWKTGRLPQDEVERKLKLIQVDVYRLMLAKHLGIELDSIDATLYFIGAAKGIGKNRIDESQCFVVAERKTEEEIEQEVRDNLYLPEGPDRE